MTKTCYKCDNVATGKEHVPPRCLFPELKDIFGYNFRENLITVPSCELHNNSKSDDDEFLLISLAGIIGNNLIGQILNETKVNRAVRRKGKNFIKKEVLRNSKIKKNKTTDDKYEFGEFGNPNYERLEFCFNSIASGLYYKEFSEKFYGKIILVFGFINYENQNMETLKQMSRHRFEIETKLNTSYKGSNPRVFTYQFHLPDEFGIIGLKMTFYDSTSVYVAFQASKIELPFDLTRHLINEGVETKFRIEDKEYTFNKK